MSYVEESLAPNEKVLLKAQINPMIFAPAVMSFIIIVLFVFPLLMLPKDQWVMRDTFLCTIAFGLFATIRLTLEAIIIMTTTEFAVTNQRIIAKRGFINRHTIEILLSKVESIAVRQNILGRAFSFGTVSVVGTGGTKESFRAIIDPIRVRNKVNQIIQ
ncbi:MAG TPA: PH domain-containing protein, partial [Anaerolineales bacterium]|nr:PH domain-containing protein [Anaerolineales bacterium]